MPALVCSGPGERCIADAMDRIVASRPQADGVLIILAGVAGGLAPVEDVPRIRTVVTLDGKVCPVGFAPPNSSETERVAILGVAQPISSPEEKQRLHIRTGAKLVDTESHVFADACARHGFAWSVVRGVSDTFEEVLPPEVIKWVGPGGKTRPARVMIDLLKKPSLIPVVSQLGKRSGACLSLVARRVAETINAWHHQGLDRA